MKRRILKKKLVTNVKRNPHFFGYTRVSSIQQADNYSLSSQQEKLIIFGVPSENIYSDVKSGQNVNSRNNLKDLLKNFNPENKTTEEDLKQLKIKNMTNKTTLVVTYLDRISRNLNEGLFLIKELENLGVQFISLDMPLSNVDSSLNQLVLTLLLWLAEFQIKNTKERQKIGIQKAIEDGKYSNRENRKLTPELLKEIQARKRTGRSAKEIYKTLDISKSSYYKALKLNQLTEVKKQKDTNS